MAEMSMHRPRSLRMERVAPCTKCGGVTTRLYMLTEVCGGPVSMVCEGCLRDVAENQASAENYRPMFVIGDVPGAGPGKEVGG